MSLHPDIAVASQSGSRDDGVNTLTHQDRGCLIQDFDSRITLHIPNANFFLPRAWRRALAADVKNGQVKEISIIIRLGETVVSYRLTVHVYTSCKFRDFRRAEQFSMGKKVHTR